jgi:hypothetical protein
MQSMNGDTDDRLEIEKQYETVFGDQASRYRSAITALMCDGVFCAEDAAVLEGMRDYLGLSCSEAEELFREEGRAYIRRRLLMFLEDGSLSPTEDAALEELVRSVGLGPQWDQETEWALVGARHTWAMAHGPLPSVQTNLGLLGNEVAHVVADCEAFEDRDRTVGVSCAGLTLSIPIVSGLRFRVGQFGVNRQTLRYSHRLGTGDLTVTSERLIFRSPERAITAKLTSIIDIIAYNDGVTVQRTQGKPLTFVLDRADEDFSLILWRAWQTARA